MLLARPGLVLRTSELHCSHLLATPSCWMRSCHSPAWNPSIPSHLVQNKTPSSVWWPTVQGHACPSSCPALHPPLFLLCLLSTEFTTACTRKCIPRCNPVHVYIQNWRKSLLKKLILKAYDSLMQWPTKLLSQPTNMTHRLKNMASHTASFYFVQINWVCFHLGTFALLPA